MRPTRARLKAPAHHVRPRQCWCWVHLRRRVPRFDWDQCAVGL